MTSTSSLLGSNVVLSAFMIVLAAFPPRYVFPIAALSYHSLTILDPKLVEWKAIFRLTKRFGLLSLVFEVFSTRIYTHFILNTLTFGDARYIATGHGFATTNIYFRILFSRLAGLSICLVLIIMTLMLQTPFLIGMCISFVFSIRLSPRLINFSELTFSIIRLIRALEVAAPLCATFLHLST